VYPVNFFLQSAVADMAYCTDPGMFSVFLRKTDFHKSTLDHCKKSLDVLVCGGNAGKFGILYKVCSTTS